MDPAVEQLEIALESADIGSFFCDMPLRKIHVNKTWRRHFFLPEATAPDATVTFDQFYGMLHPEDRQKTRQAIEQARVTRCPYDIEHRVLATDGRTRWIHAKGLFRYDANGRPFRFDGVTLDISEQKALEEKAAKARADLTVVFESISDAFVAVDGQWRITHMNGEAIRMARQPREALLGKSHWDLWPFALGTRIEHEYRRAVQNKTPAHFEFCFEPSQTWLDIHAYPSGDGLAIYFRNVSQQKRNQAELLESEARFRNITNALPQIVWMASPEGDIIFLNDRWQSYTGMPPDQGMGRAWTHAVHPDDIAATAAAWKKSLESGDPCDATFRIRRHDGQYRWHVAQSLPLRDARGSIVQWFGAAMDIHERKESADLVRKAKHEADLANQAKDRFLAVLSHELRTPLTPVLAAVEALISNPAAPPEIAEQMQMVRRNVELEARLIDDLLDLTKISKGKLQLNFSAVDVHAAVRHVLEICAPDIAAKQLSVRTQLAANRPVVHGDAARLRQVFWNVLKNAIKFTPEAGSIAIRSKNIDGLISVAITDTGIGIAPEALPGLFDAFEQADADTGRRFGGLGLGLAIVKAITELHGGTVGAASPGTGHGATLTVELPTVDAQHAAVKAPDERRSIGPLNILLVEDHADTQKVMVRVLQSLGHTVTPAGSVAAALLAAEQQRFNLIISDIGLPDGTGLDFMRQLREKQKIPAIALTGFGMENDVRQSAEVGFVAHLTKPVNFDRLEQAISRAVATEPSSSDAA